MSGILQRDDFARQVDVAEGVQVPADEVVSWPQEVGEGGIGLGGAVGRGLGRCGAEHQQHQPRGAGPQEQSNDSGQAAGCPPWAGAHPSASETCWVGSRWGAQDCRMAQPTKGCLTYQSR